MGSSWRSCVCCCCCCCEGACGRRCECCGRSWRCCCSHCCCCAIAARAAGLCYRRRRGCCRRRHRHGEEGDLEERAPVPAASASVASAVEIGLWALLFPSWPGHGPSRRQPLTCWPFLLPLSPSLSPLAWGVATPAASRLALLGPSAHCAAGSAGEIPIATAGQRQ